MALLCRNLGATFGVSSMKLSLPTAATLIAATLLTATASQAATYRWCADYNGEPRNCGFSTYAQCMEALSGNGGTCVENQAYQPMPEHAHH